MVDETGNPLQPPEPDIPPAEAVTPSMGLVVNLADVAKAKAAKGAPTTSAGANATDKGAGGNDAAAPDKKPEKTIDWGAFNSLIAKNSSSKS